MQHNLHKNRNYYRVASQCKLKITSPQASHTKYLHSESILMANANNIRALAQLQLPKLNSCIDPSSNLNPRNLPQMTSTLGFFQPLRPRSGDSARVLCGLILKGEKLLFSFTSQSVSHSHTVELTARLLTYPFASCITYRQEAVRTTSTRTPSSATFGK